MGSAGDGARPRWGPPARAVVRVRYRARAASGVSYRHRRGGAARAGSGGGGVHGDRDVAACGLGGGADAAAVAALPLDAYDGGAGDGRDALPRLVRVTVRVTSRQATRVTRPGGDLIPAPLRVTGQEGDSGKRAPYTTALQPTYLEPRRGGVPEPAELVRHWFDG